MAKLGFVALSLAAVVVFSAWAFRSQESAPPRDQPTITVSYPADWGTAYVWEWKGNEVVAMTIYSADHPKGELIKRRFSLPAEKK